MRRPLTQMGERRHKTLGKSNFRANEPKIHRSKSHIYLYGQTPRARKAMDFEKLSEYLELSVEETAKRVLDMDGERQAELLREFYEHLQYESMDELYNKVICEIREEAEELKQIEEELALSCRKDTKTKAKKSQPKPELQKNESFNGSFEKSDDDDQIWTSPEKGKALKIKPAPPSKYKSPFKRKGQRWGIEEEDDEEILEEPCSSFLNRDPKPAPPSTYQSSTRQKIPSPEAAPIEESKYLLKPPKPAPKCLYKKRERLHNSGITDEDADFYRNMFKSDETQSEEKRTEEKKSLTCKRKRLNEDLNSSFYSDLMTQPNASKILSEDDEKQFESSSFESGSTFDRLVKQGKIKKKQL